MAHSMNDAYLEYRKACYDLTYQSAVEAGLLKQLADPMTVEDVADVFSCSPSKVESLRSVLKALQRFGAVVSHDGSPAKYQINRNFSHDDISFDRELIAHAIGEDNTQELVDGHNYGAMADDLRNDQNLVGAAFDYENLSHWNDFLEMPFYKKHRIEAVLAIAKEGNTCIDLGSGLGYGLAEIAAIVGEKGKVVGIEVSRDFIKESVDKTSKLPQVQHIQGNLDDGFSFLSDSQFDGAMIIGAFHFLKNRELFFREVNRILKPGGVFCLGHVYTENGAYDQEIMDLRFVTRIPRGYSIKPSELDELAKASNFEIADERFFTGCIGWFKYRALS